MTQWSSKETARLATLARIKLSSEELAQYTEQLPKIVEFFEQISSSSAESSVQSHPISQDLLREDKENTGPASLSLEDLKKLAPVFDEDNQRVITPAVFGEYDEL